MRVFGALALAGLAACASSAPAPDLGIRLEPDGAAIVDVAAPRTVVYEASIAEIRRRGGIEVSSLEGGWIVGSIGRSAVRVDLSNSSAERTRLRVAPFTLSGTTRHPYSRVSEEVPQFELARRIVERSGA